MKTLICDICKKLIDEPVPTRNYWHIREYDICDPCKDVLDARLKPMVRGHEPYSADWYEQQVLGFIEKGVYTSRL